MSSGFGRNSPRSSDDELEEGEIRDVVPYDHREPDELEEGEIRDVPYYRQEPDELEEGEIRDVPYYRQEPDELGKGLMACDAPCPDDRKDCTGRVEIDSKASTRKLDILTMAATASLEGARRSQESSAADSSSSENPSTLCERVRSTFFPGVVPGDLIRGCEMVLLIEKPLGNEDVSPPARRLRLPKRQLQAKFLRTAEKEALKTRDKNGAPTEMTVLLLGPSGESCHLGLIRLDLKSKKETEYHLVGQGWVDLVARNELKEDQVIRLYSYRIASNLCFALVCP